MHYVLALPMRVLKTCMLYLISIMNFLFPSIGPHALLCVAMFAYVFMCVFLCVFCCVVCMCCLPARVCVSCAVCACRVLFVHVCMFTSMYVYILANVP